jgi:hypothetical protein
MKRKVRRMTESGNRGVYGNWNDSNNRLDNTGPAGSVLSMQVGIISTIRACTDIQLGLDSCSSWSRDFE